MVMADNLTAARSAASMTRQGWLFLSGSVAAAIVIDLIIWAGLTCHDPAWRTTLSSAPSCSEFWLNRYQGLIGALATLLAGFLAYRAAMSAAKEAERQARDAKRAALNEQMQRLYRDIDALRLAAGYLGEYAGRFPSVENPDKTIFFNAFRLARNMARDFVSQAALSAPGGYGARIHTLMTAIQQLGDRIEEQLDKPGANTTAAIDFFGDDIVMRVSGLQSIRSQMRSDLPGYEAQLIELRDELAALESDD
jgi:hypothetical protein